MNELNVLIFLSEAERTLLIAALEDRLNALSKQLQQGEREADTGALCEQMKQGVMIIKKLRRAEAVSQRVQTPQDQTLAPSGRINLSRPHECR